MKENRYDDKTFFDKYGQMARSRLGLRCGECAIVGDQIFTDVVGANLCGMKSVLLSPIEPEEGITFRVRRFFEKPLRRRLAARKDLLR